MRHNVKRIEWPLVKKALHLPFTMSYVYDHAVLFSAEVYVMGMLFCLGIFLSFYLLTFLMACLDNRRYAHSLSVSLLYPSNTRHSVWTTGGTQPLSSVSLLYPSNTRHSVGL